MRRDEQREPTPATPTGARSDPEADVARPGVPDRPDERAPREAVTGSPDQDVTRRTGPGTGGATETAGRMPHHEGVHGRRSAKG